MPPEQQQQQNRSDLVLAPGEYAYYQDTTKGTLLVNVGPSKTSLSNTDQLVRYDPTNRKFNKVPYVDDAIVPFPNAQEGQYIILSNPIHGAGDEHPKDSVGQAAATLKMGRKVNIPGPAYFPLWPGQHAEVIPGHHLHSNQYLLVRVYNEEEAKANWNKAVVTSAGGEGEPSIGAAAPNLTMGQLIIVKGTEISFYIPPTGIEVVPEENDGDYIRDAVTLERLEYCILLSESGEKRYVPGPAVVFPEPTEGFIRDENNNSRKFRAIELSPISGIHIKVIADYKEGEKEYHAGDELFITGKDQAIYFPREEHSIITYGDRKIYFAIALPEGEGRYVLDRDTGIVSLVRGPLMFLPDPRRQVIVRRILDPKSVNLLYPGNTEALQINQQLAEVSRQAGSPDYLAATTGGSNTPLASASIMASMNAAPVGAEVSTRQYMRSGRAAPVEKSGDFKADTLNRGTTYTPPRSITLDTKYEGAVSVNVWTGYAILIVNKAGDRRVVVGPETVLLKYDENLMALELSTGTPKVDRFIKTAYLRVTNNKVSDRVDAETRDLVKVSLTLSYRLNFEGDNPIKWFEVENYVKFMTDHLRSLIRNVVKRTGIEVFYSNSIDIIRDAVLGHAEDGKPRPGRLFPENAMRIYDVEVLSTDIMDSTVSGLLTKAQQESIQGSILVMMETEGLERTKRLEVITREKLLATDETAEARHQYALNIVGRTAAEEQADKDAEIELTKLEAALIELVLANTRRQEVQRLEFVKGENDLQAEVDRLATGLFVQRAEALSERITAALLTFGDKIVMEHVTSALAPLAVLGQSSVADMLRQLFNGGPAEELVRTLTARPTFLNGGQAPNTENRSSEPAE